MVKDRGATDYDTIMFHDIPRKVLERMRELEQKDLRDRADGTPRKKKLRQIPPQVGRFIAIMAASAPKGRWIEIGTSAGYSTLWLALACRASGRKVTTFEILAEKLNRARFTFDVAGVQDAVELIHGNALDSLSDYENIAFCFLDAEKEIYLDCYELVVPRMVRGGILIADNAISHRVTLRSMLERVLCDDRVDALVVPIGRGQLVCRRR